MKANYTAWAALLLAAGILSSCASESSTGTQTPETAVSTESSTVNDNQAAETAAVSQQTEPEENAETAAPVQEGAVTFSAASGVYENEFELTLSSSEGEIYYTLDGSDPTSDKALRYDSPIRIYDRKGEKNVVSAVEPSLFAGSYCELSEDKTGFVTTVSAPSDEAVDKCTVIRAAVRLPDGSFTDSTNAVYFIGAAEDHIRGLSASCQAAGEDLAVISLAVDYDDFFDSKKGIYVKGDLFDEAVEEYLSENKIFTDLDKPRRLAANYNQKGRDWERRAAMTFMEFSSDGSVNTALTQDCGVRIQGNYSRSDLQKAFRLYARNDYGSKSFKYPVFGEDHTDDSGKVMDKYDKLVLRAGGNCAFTAKFNDTYWQSLVRESACETKSSRPCVVYLNGEYWGLYVLEEDYSASHLEQRHGVNKDDVVICKGDAETIDIGYKLDEGTLPEGETDDYYYRELVRFFETHEDASSDEAYDELCSLVDPDSVRDYFAIECWINNKWDWPGKNWSMWRTSATDETNPYADGRWRYMIYDVEFGGISGEWDMKTNTIKEDNYKPYGLLDKTTENPAVLCFAYMMTNEGFRNSFEERLRDLSANEMKRDTALAALDRFEGIYSPLYMQFFERYPGAGSERDALYGGYGSIKCMRDFVSQRADYIDPLIEYCERVLNKAQT